MLRFPCLADLITYTKPGWDSRPMLSLTDEREGERGGELRAVRVLSSEGYG
jgi:hypothetical protein